MLTIIDYGVGNLKSIQNMLKKAGVVSIIANKEEDILKASKLIIPGMGHFDNCMISLNRSGLRPAIEHRVTEMKIPVLGICVGVQMFMEDSEEGTEKGLGWIKGKTIRFNQSLMNGGYKIPNMGWLSIVRRGDSSLLDELDEARFYFAHSFHVSPFDEKDILATASYGYDFAVALEKDNILGVQFHPEKSHKYGMHLLKNFSVNF